jgi:hypothetical protein
MIENIYQYPIIHNFRHLKFYAEDHIIYCEMPGDQGLMKLVYDINIDKYRLIEIIQTTLNEFLINKLKG